MRGYGQSDKPSGIYNYTISKLTKDVKEVVAALGRISYHSCPSFKGYCSNSIDCIGYKSCVLVAHDWGGAVAWQTTLLYPEIVDKLIVCNCPHPKAFMEHLNGGSFTQMLKSWYVTFLVLIRLYILQVCNLFQVHVFLPIPLSAGNIFIVRRF